jgi:hypothetical protein
VKKLLLLAIATPSLPACVPMMAVSAASMVAEQAAGKPVDNQGLQPQAREACTVEAAKYGAVHVIDVEQNRVNKIIVWGTVETAKGKQSFQCDFGTRIAAFKLRPIARR